MACDVLISVSSRTGWPTTQAVSADNGCSRGTAEEVEQLRAALISNRRISMAIGILMRDQRIDEHQAFDYLRRTSQNANRKLRDVAEDVIRAMNDFGATNPNGQVASGR